jgi:zinc protease
VRKFHTDFYRPDNATLVVVGDFDEKQLDGWIDKYFAPVPKPARALPRVTAKEPARTGELRAVEYAPGVPLPAVAFTFLAPPQSDEDIAALQVAEVILSGGESSRLYRSLVYEQQVAQVAQAGTDLREDVSLFTFIAILASGKKPEDAERALLAEIKKMQDAPVTAAELEKAKNQLVTGQLRERETNNGKASALAEAAVLLGDPNRVNTELESLSKVTAADVQRVARQYLGAHKVVLTVVPEGKKEMMVSAGGE